METLLVPKFHNMKCESFLHNNTEYSLKKKTPLFFFCQCSWFCYSVDAVLNWILCPSLLKCEVCRSQSIHFRAVS